MAKRQKKGASVEGPAGGGEAAPADGMSKRKRRRERAADDAVKAAEGEKVPEPRRGASGEKAWKSVNLSMDVMKEFESMGGMVLEEVEGEDLVAYAPKLGGRFVADDGSTVELPEETEKAKKKRKKQSAVSQEARPEKIREENAQMKEELAKLKKEKAAVDIAVSQEVAVAALTEWQGFDLHPALLSNIHRLGFTKPTDVQARCLIPAIRQRKDLVGAAETGSGKTLAFGLPILHHTLTTLGWKSGDADPSLDAQGIFGLIILPTRELAVQVQSHINAVAQNTPVHAACVVGGMAIQKQKRLLGRKPQIVVGTPGRTFALLGLGKEAEDRVPWFIEGVKYIRHLVLDEADRLVESGHFRELDGILKLLYDSLLRPQQLQTFVFSATLTLDPRSEKHRIRDGEDSGKVEALMERLQFREQRAIHAVDLTRPERQKKNGEAGELDAEVSAGPADIVHQADARHKGSQLPEQLEFRELMCMEDKDREAVLVMWLLRRYRWCELGVELGRVPVMRKPAAESGLVVLFVNSITSVMRLTSILAILLEAPSAEAVLAKVRMTQGGKAKGSGQKVTVDVFGLHSQMRQKDRLKKMERFRACGCGVLVCTDIAARGLDVKDITSVVHYHAPRNAETFVHRSGRTARAGKEGESIAFVSPGDVAQWKRLYAGSRISTERIARIDITPFQLDAARQAAGMVIELESKVHKIKKVNNKVSSMRKMAEECDLVYSEDEGDPDKEQAMAPRRALWGLYQQLQERVRRPPKREGGGPTSTSGRPGGSKTRGKKRQLGTAGSKKPNGKKPKARSKR